MKLTLIIAVVMGLVAFLAVRLRGDRVVTASPHAHPSLPAPAPNVGEPDPDALLSGFSMADRDTEFFGRWKETVVNGLRVPFQTGDGQIRIYAGGFNADQEQISDVYLGSVTAGQSLPADGSEQRLDAFVGTQGRAVAERYFLYATGATEYPQLKIPEVRDGLISLSDAVVEVAIFESAGVQIEIDRKRVDGMQLAKDVRTVVTMAAALEANLVQSPGR